MPRYKLTVEYDGSSYVGWQAQEGLQSVQAALEAAVLGFCGETVKVFAAGRTDAGVHATGQVAHIELTRTFPDLTVRNALNAHLKTEAVAVRAAERVDDDFHARFSAMGRAYLYRIVNRPAPVVLDHSRVWWVSQPLDAAAMHEAAQRLVGHHDFSTFRAAECQSHSPEKTLDVLEVAQAGEEVRIVARSRSFLHHQVRNMVGTLRLVGAGRWTADDVTAALHKRDRRAGGPTAPPWGLYLTEVTY